MILSTLLSLLFGAILFSLYGWVLTGINSILTNVIIAGLGLVLIANTIVISKTRKVQRFVLVGVLLATIALSVGLTMYKMETLKDDRQPRRYYVD